MMRKVFVVLTALAVVGCGGYQGYKPPATVKVTGKVLLPSGQPLTVGTIRFEPVATGQGGDAYAAVTQDGSFVVKSFGDREGMKPGKYVAYLDPTTVTMVAMVGANKRSTLIPAAATVPVTYLQAGTTKWKFEVAEGGMDLGTLKMN